jgi:Ni/Fe-hydrogenase subunit HybB-like protein
MDLVGIPVILGIIAVSVGVPAAFILGVRRLVTGLTDHRTMMAVLERDTLPMPPITIRVGTGWTAIRAVLMVVVLATGTALILLRFVLGIGAVTNLSDAFPLGLWIGFDVMGGVALAAGAFVMAGMAHIFRVEKLEPLVRPAILTGLLGYLMAVASLLVDLGRPYNVWRPLIHWQHRSPLWEVGVCVACYTTVLLIEFMPVILERVNTFEVITKRLPTVPLYRFLRRFSIVFVILGVVLSTMHQSSLGSLWVLVPQKLHPLWYTIRLPILFWLSAVAAGFAMTIVESTLSSKAFKRGLERDLLADLAKYAAVMLTVYLGVKFVDLAARGGLSYLTETSLQAGTFWAEVILGAVVPILLFSIKSLRRKPAALFTGAAMVVLFGIVLNRLNVSMIGLYPYTGVIYTPSWMEILVSVTIISLGVLAFGTAARYLPVFPEEAGERGSV